MTTALKKEIRELARESVREVFKEEMLHLRSSLLPMVSKKEQNAIERLYKKPTRRGTRKLRVHI